MPKRPKSSDPQFEKFWKMQRRKEAVGAAERAWRRATRDASADEIITGYERFANATSSTEKQYVPLPATWLNAKRWLDEPAGNAADQGGVPHGGGQASDGERHRAANGRPAFGSLVAYTKRLQAESDRIIGNTEAAAPEALRPFIKVVCKKRAEAQARDNLSPDGWPEDLLRLTADEIRRAEELAARPLERLDASLLWKKPGFLA